MHDGLGFRDIKAFNLALLAKQGWRLYMGQSFLFTSVLKGRYYPFTSFMEASTGSNLS